MKRQIKASRKEVTVSKLYEDAQLLFDDMLNISNDDYDNMNCKELFHVVQDWIQDNYNYYRRHIRHS